MEHACSWHGEAGDVLVPWRVRARGSWRVSVDARGGLERVVLKRAGGAGLARRLAAVVRRGRRGSARRALCARAHGQSGAARVHAAERVLRARVGSMAVRGMRG